MVVAAAGMAGATTGATLGGGLIDPAISVLAYATFAVRRARRGTQKRADLLEGFTLHVNECYHFASIAKVPTNGSAAKVAEAVAIIAGGGRRPTLSTQRRLNLFARLLGCKMHSPCLRVCFVATVICIKLPAAYFIVGCMNVGHAAMHRASTRLQLIIGSLCRTRATLTLAIVSASARLRLFWLVTHVINHLVDYAIVRMLNTARMGCAAARRPDNLEAADRRRVGRAEDRVEQDVPREGLLPLGDEVLDAVARFVVHVELLDLILHAIIVAADA